MRNTSAHVTVLAIVTTFAAVACDPLDIVVGSRFDGGGGNGSGGGDTGGGVPILGCMPTTPGVWQNVAPTEVSLALQINGASNYGFHNVVVDPLEPSTVYVGVDRQGLWRSIDCGATWQKRNTGANGDRIDEGAPWALAIDPVDPRILYMTSGEGALGLWKSVNGGVDWSQLFGPGNVTEPFNLFGQSPPDLYSVAIDPSNPQHLVCGFRGGWLDQNGTGDWLASGVAESLDGGATWQLKAPHPDMGSNHNVFFLDDGDAWLVLGEIGDGAYRTIDAGQTFTRVNTSALRTGGGQLYRAGDGTYYHTGGFGIFRSTDGGATWVNVIEGQGPSTQGITGDGQRIYASDGAAIAGQLYGEPFPAFLSAPESAGDTGWAEMTQLFDNGANHLAADRKNHFIYASAWRVGLLRMYAP